MTANIVTMLMTLCITFDLIDYTITLSTLSSISPARWNGAILIPRIITQIFLAPMSRHLSIIHSMIYIYHHSPPPPPHPIFFTHF